MKLTGTQHWTNTREGKVPFDGHNVKPGKSSAIKSLANRWRRRKTRIHLREMIIKEVIT